MKRTMKYLSLAFLFLELSLLAACQFEWPSFLEAKKPALDVGDGGFLSGTPCAAPCFWNITPDITTKKQATEIFQEYFDVSHCDEWPGLRDGQNIWCDPVGIQFSISEIVDHISYSPTQPITVEEVITKYGQPNSVNVLGWSQDNGGVTTSVTMLLFFDNIHTVIGLPEQSSTNYNVGPLTEIGGITYDSITKWRRLGENDRQPWAGFDTYPGPYLAGP